MAVPALDGAENYIKTLDHGGYFEVTALSKEDLKKTELYHQNAERAKHRRRLPTTASISTALK